MDAIVLLKEDHKTVEKLFKQFEQAGPDAHRTKQKIVAQVVEELTAHTYIEETIFYPAARAGAPDTTGHILESVEEEEKDWFPQVRRSMGRNRLQELGEEMAEAKGEAPRDPLGIPSASS
ncbi:hemerythrin [Nonomuraea sp. WAC 01424]|uniref:hemerythrin domain-containing protein n=1 Tax=Nonomuraea sp. WAC 01424 TaxID=2203200 RepID=UPI000F7701F7|nr:hemerythrin domain-containing protein [Nonomuraea sp. WAC 01424]RSM94466.1 hemerythrin [Nonomuraea sp. WAC 01424]